MTSRLRLTTEQRWAVIRDAWERGDFDRMRRLLSHAEAGLPEGAANWLAEVLSGEAKRPRGRRRGDPGQHAADFGRRLQVAAEFKAWLRVYQNQASDPDAPPGRGTPTELAIEHTAATNDMSAEAVSWIVHPRRKRKVRKSGN